MTKRLFAFILLLAIAAPLCAQDPQPEQPEEEPADESAEEELVGIPTDYNDYLKKLYPQTDPGGRHDIFNLKNPQGKEERHEYTTAMAQLLIAYLSPELDFGATLSKLFDQYSRGKEANSPVFKTLYSIVLLYYPPGNPNTSEAQQVLREAAALATDFAYPQFMLAQFEFARLVQVADVSPRATLQALDKALEIRPDFLRAILLKCEVYFRYQPPRFQEILEMIKPYVDKKLPEAGYDFEDVLKVYARCPGTDVQDQIQTYLASGKLNNSQIITAREIAGTHHFQEKRYDESIVQFEALLKVAENQEDPRAVLNGRKWLAMCWDMKSRDLKKNLDDPAVKKRYNEFLDKSIELHRSCAELEAKDLPISMRGNQALQYIDFLAYGLNRKREAMDWLKDYLEGTDLNRSQRNRLENLANLLDAELDPTEEKLIAVYRGHLQRKDLDRLAVSLGIAKEQVRIEGKHFKESASLTFFLEVLDSGNRLVDGYAAFLVADTARQLGGDTLPKAGDALIARLEKENELKSEAQANLHTELAAALKLLESWTHMERAVRHSAKMLNEAKDELNVRSLTQPIIDNWNDESLVKKLKPPMRKASRMDVYSAEDAAEWMTKKLAEGIKKTAEAVAKEAEEEPSEE